MDCNSDTMDYGSDELENASDAMEESSNGVLDTSEVSMTEAAWISNSPASQPVNELSNDRHHAVNTENHCVAYPQFVGFSWISIDDSDQMMLT